MRLARTWVRCDESGESEGDECVVELHCVFRVGVRKRAWVNEWTKFKIQREKAGVAQGKSSRVSAILASLYVLR